MDKRTKGLYFKCRQHYNLMHRCPEKELKPIAWEQEEEVDSVDKLLVEVHKREMEDWEMMC